MITKISFIIIWTATMVQHTRSGDFFKFINEFINQSESFIPWTRVCTGNNRYAGGYTTALLLLWIRTKLWRKKSKRKGGVSQSNIFQLSLVHQKTTIEKQSPRYWSGKESDWKFALFLYKLCLELSRTS